MMRRLTLLFGLLIATCPVFATHQRAGEITYRYKGGLTYEVTILTYTFAPSPADRPELDILWGDGTTSTLPRIIKEDLGNDIRRNVYVGEHTYAGVGEYLLSVEDPNRNYGILNIPNSVNIPFFIESLLIISPFLVPNNSPQLLLPPIDNGCTNIPYLHNPGAYDSDGDSLSYRLVTCRGGNGLPILGYVLPNAVGSNAGTSLSINPVTGDFLWDSPKMQGEYNIAILIEEWRNGYRIGYVTRDMQIIIEACSNLPPEFVPVPDTCVVAGGMVDFDVTATDPNGNLIRLSGTGGPIVMTDHPADFDQPVSGYGTVTSHFHWETVCNHVRLLPYQVYFKAKDSSIQVNLIDLMTVNILVIGPPVPGLTVVTQGNSMKVSWNQSTCTNAIGYRLFRRTGYYGFHPDTCETGVPSYTGYQMIAEMQGLADTSYVDDDNGNGLIHGNDYCYIVIAYYPDGAESKACPEVCATLRHDLPIITNVSIQTTDAVNGSAQIRWVKPAELDTIQTPGPYKYFVYRASPYSGTFMLIDSLDGLTDTSYLDNFMNTKDIQYGYRIGLLNNTPGNRFEVGRTQPASSVYLKIQPTDERNLLSWTAYVPWDNDTSIVYRYNSVSGLFDSIGYTTTNTYADSGLVNGLEYCYRVKTMGAYSDTELPSPLFNWSQQSCATPLDNVAPCPPVLTVTVDCDLNANHLVWNNPNHSCTDDVKGYRIYYSPLINGSLTLIADLTPATDTSFIHEGMPGLAGCYVVTAYDSVGNESSFSNKVCLDIDLCPVYTLPNVFTPNSDQTNDFFIPFPYHSVEKIDMFIYNRWGQLVFETHDPDILWDGRDRQSGNMCSDGVYFYMCDVYELKLEGVTKRRLSGVIHLLTGKE